MIAVWNEPLLNEKNITLAFRLILKEKLDFTIKLAAASCYKLYVDGKFVSFGPHRAALGYAKTYEKGLHGKVIVVEVNSLQIKNFCWMQQSPFFACTIHTTHETYNSLNFSCHLINDRVQKVQRYGYQRGFIECYKIQHDKTAFYNGALSYPTIKTVEVKAPVFINKLTHEPLYSTHFPIGIIDKGYVNINRTKKIWRDRAHYIKHGVEGFYLKDCEEKVIDEVSQFDYAHENDNNIYQYTTFDFGRNLTGFTNIMVKTNKPCTIYVVFDEILTQDPKLKIVDFKRNDTANVHKWTLTQAGTFMLSTFEPYTMRYSVVITDNPDAINISFTDYENPDVDLFSFSCLDTEISDIIKAAQRTFAQNSVDLLSDCPSRERAGWLCDAYFSSISERVFTGNNLVEKSFLDNYSLFEKSNDLPQNMIPMCYPADVMNYQFIPNWGMWYILEVIKYASIYGNDDTVKRSKDKIFNLLTYFASKENELELLEDLEGWIFVEWSAANNFDRVCGVNIPTNICYMACLKKVGEFFKLENLIEKANRLQKTIIQLSYNGEFFVDNLIRNESSQLIQTTKLSETCQYYAFWFNLISPLDYPHLYNELMYHLGENRQKDYRKDISESNVFLGLYLRIDLLIRENKRNEILIECKKLFNKMAQTTGTLWEHTDIRASCNHAFASYAIRWIIFALTGYDVLSNKSTSTQGIGIDCDFKIPLSNKHFLSLSVKENVVHMQDLEN